MSIENAARDDFLNYSLDELNSEKRNVKNELKSYDNAFFTLFQKVPSRGEKEPMRPLYIYYQNL